MTNQSNTARAEDIDHRITAISRQLVDLTYKSSAGVISDEETRLRGERARLHFELNNLRPYRVCENGSTFVVAFKGMFLTDATGDAFLTFQTANQAQAWIDETTKAEEAA